jgi:hypothetical protein
MNNNSESPEFYIGWIPKAPGMFAKHIKKVLLSLLVVVVISGLLLGISQKKFGTGVFEFGVLTEIKGVYFNQPVSCIKVVNGKDIFGNLSYITIPLLGFGKMGAAGIIAAIEKEQHVSVDQKEITLKGTLLYNDGKLLMQIDGNDKPLTHTGNSADAGLLPEKQDLGDMQVKGEIVDPKCYFGVMKPGQGKPHKDCAIRCILGGIPPVLKVTDETGNENYYLVVGPNGEKMNDTVKDYVAEPVTIHAKAIKYDDWVVLYVKEKGITRYSYIEDHFGNTIASCGPACMKR